MQVPSVGGRCARSRIAILLLGLMLLGAGGPARACLGINLSAASLDFGTYNPLSPVPATTTADISITCLTAGIGGILLGYEVGLDSTGQLLSGTFPLRFELFRNAGLSDLWGVVGSGETISGLFQILNINQTRILTVYGRLPVFQSIPAGVYSESVTVTIEF